MTYLMRSTLDSSTIACLVFTINLSIIYPGSVSHIHQHHLQWVCVHPLLIGSYQALEFLLAAQILRNTLFALWAP